MLAVSETIASDIEPFAAATKNAPIRCKSNAIYSPFPEWPIH